MNDSPDHSRQRVAILGASDDPDRYAHRAFAMLRDAGHTPVPIHPRLAEVGGVPVFPSLAAAGPPIDTLTLYVNGAVSISLADEIVAARPGRVIFNPGAESPALAARLDEAGIPWEEACTLVLLGTGQF
ncbi:MAG: CoA-binding protein [Verrucomicrobiae bacterium]|nr:CoA-binding protein [Verrucomicrobiae bacterium]MCP5539876.1 CoA-binding protein [Akkermansiaceae bacterium]